MLERIVEIKGIGLLHEATAKSRTCQRATLVYADNGRGKSTIASILRSVANSDAGLLLANKTIDGTNAPRVELQFGSGHKVTFENGKWSEPRPEMLVFDAEFVARNVHSGGTVSTDQRKNLLEFALGEASVAARHSVDEATGKAKAAGDKVKGLEAQISGHQGELTLKEFEQCGLVPDLEEKIVSLQKRIASAGNISAIQAKSLPVPVVLPAFDLAGLFSVLRLSLQDVHEDAERIVKQHVAKLGGRAAEMWLSQGRQFSVGDSCPYCDQEISGNDLIRAYQGHFNASYGELKGRVSSMRAAVQVGASNAVVESVEKNIALAVLQAQTWSEHLSLPAIEFDANAVQQAMIAFREFIEGLEQLKGISPAEPIGSNQEMEKAQTLWDMVLAPIRSANAQIVSVGKLVATYKRQLSGDTVLSLQQQLRHLEAAKRRSEPKVVELFAGLSAARRAVDESDKAKKLAREALDDLMGETLGKYQATINSLLKKFGASFQIQNLSANFRGSSPRSEYGLLLRGKTVALEGGPPSFATALSEGDKRTLAFAFFIASTFQDPKLPEKIVVIDDPMCSLDRNRRHHTRLVLKKIHSAATQLIVLAHDAYFLRDLRDALIKEDKSALISIFQLAASKAEYSDFASINIDKECESAYLQHHRILNEFSAGTGADSKAVAKAIRPMLEGYLHRRFPGLIPRDKLFGQIVVQIRDSDSTSPLRHARNLIDDLNEINEYAGQFHHDTNAGADTTVIVAAELKTCVDQALAVVHRGAPS